MTKLDDLYGFSVDIEEVAHLVDNDLFAEEESWKRLHREIAALSPEEHFLYLHAIVISSKFASHFGVDGGLEGRLDHLVLSLSVNPRSRLTRRFGRSAPYMQFLNHLAGPAASLGADAKVVNPTYSQYEITATIPSAFFEKRTSFRLYAFTYVSAKVPPRRRKLTASVTPFPTKVYDKKLRRLYGEPTKLQATLSKPVTLQQLRDEYFDTQEIQIGETIVFLTVNSNETEALLDTFLPPGEAPRQLPIDGVTYNLLGQIGPIHLVHTIAEMGSNSVGASQERTRHAIDNWHPTAIIAIGIAFGVDEKCQQIGDVLVSTQLQGYELGKVGHKGDFTSRGDKSRASDILCNRLRTTHASRSRSGLQWPTVRFGMLLSGEKLINNRDYRESLKTRFPEAIGGEMEGSGVYTACTSTKTDWVVVKGICDWGHQKGRPEKEKWQKLAAKNACMVVRAALEVGSLTDGAALVDDSST